MRLISLTAGLDYINIDIFKFSLLNHLTRQTNITAKSNRNAKERIELEEEVKNLSDRVSEAAHGVQSISMTSIPNDFFDEERDKGMVYCSLFQLKSWITVI